jgi:lipopolysaccharide export system protein LptA
MRHVLLPTLACLALTGPAQAAEDIVPPVGPETGLPIDLEAASSRFDGRARTLSFEKVRIRQGAMTIRADHGEAARLDFENSRWRFDGDVVLENQGTRVECDDADLQFEGHALRSAVLRGDPVRLEQQRAGSREPTKARAALMEYDVTAGTIRLTGAAWLSDGANDVSGERIAYDLRREYVTAEGDGDGQVRMKIKPPPRKPTGQPKP